MKATRRAPDMPSVSARFSKALSGLLPKGGSVLCALSGGKDSVALLLLLKESPLPGKIAACHVHHGIRGEEADRDERFCRDLCRKLGVELVVKKANVPEAAKREKKGLEEAAREIRYRLLRDAAKETGCSFIATAHTENDQAETVLFRAVRGTGLAGLCGIQRKSGSLIRPLLDFSTDEILAYLNGKNQTFRTDSTNSDQSYSRNFIRAVLLEDCKKINPRASSSLARLSSIAGDYLLLAKRAAKEAEKENKAPFSGGKASLSLLRRLEKEDGGKAVLFEIFSQMLEKRDLGLTEERFSALLSLLKSGQRGKIIEIENGFAFQIKKDDVVLEKAARPSPPLEPVILQEGIREIPDLSLRVEISPKVQGNARNIHKNLLILDLGFDKIEGKLFLRSLLPGDRIRMNGQTKSVRRLFSDAHVPPDQRARLPLLCDGAGILWIPFFGLDDRCRPEGQQTYRTVSLSGERMKELQPYFL